MATKRSLAAILGAATTALAAIGFTSASEGVRLAPYKDTLAAHVNTVCYGETNVAMRVYTLAECRAMLGTSLADYAAEVERLTPQFSKLSDGQKISAVDFAYNVGITNYAKSTLRKRYSLLDFPGACDEYLRWTMVNGEDCSKAGSGCGGIYTRRQNERKLCRGES